MEGEMVETAEIYRPLGYVLDLRTDTCMCPACKPDLYRRTWWQTLIDAISDLNAVLGACVPF